MNSILLSKLYSTTFMNTTNLLPIPGIQWITLLQISREPQFPRNGINLQLEWDEVEYGTYKGNRYPEINGIWYKIYAGTQSYFVCDETTYITTVTDLDYDYPLTGEDMKFFKVEVSDKP
ncbi:MAG: hypothetical protein H8E57_01780 [Candidatus Cloacimonetes bacterium]|nr:hypothetical protein [Candidatus Cloacimonadota bacterium]